MKIKNKSNKQSIVVQLIKNIFPRLLSSCSAQSEHLRMRFHSILVFFLFLSRNVSHERHFFFVQLFLLIFEFLVVFHCLVVHAPHLFCFGMRRLRRLSYVITIHWFLHGRVNSRSECDHACDSVSNNNAII